METGSFSYPTPFTPPTTVEDELSLLRLIRSRRVGVTTFHRLIEQHGSAAEALRALPELARAAGAKDYVPCPEGVAAAEIRNGRKLGARPIFFGQREYPALLAAAPDAPAVLWCLGDAGLLARPRIALVGARNASSLGMRMARRLAETLAEAGLVVVSGLARGIDAAAHGAALTGGTIAVQAGGVDVLYPAENAELAVQIGQRGLRLTEQPPGLTPQARHFPMRNRIIAGLCRAVVVVEAAPRSGSLITARIALDLGREVMAVPGHPLDGRAGGCNALIRDGALLVRSAEDIISALEASGTCIAEAAGGEGASLRPGAARGLKHDGPVSGPGPEPGDRAAERGRGAGGSTSAGAAQKHLRGDRDCAAFGSAPGAPSARQKREEGRPESAGPQTARVRSLHQQILDRLSPSPLPEDQLIRDLSVPAASVAVELLGLECEGLVARQPGGMLVKVV